MIRGDYDEVLRCITGDDSVFKTTGQSIGWQCRHGKTLLISYLQHGYIEKIRHNYYAVKSLDTKQPVPDRFAIASNINEKTYISHHAAFEYYGMTNQVFTEIQVSTSKPFMNFDFDGVRYVCILCKMESGIASPCQQDSYN